MHAALSIIMVTLSTCSILYMHAALSVIMVTLSTCPLCMCFQKNFSHDIESKKKVRDVAENGGKQVRYVMAFA